MTERLTTDWRDSALCAQVDPDAFYPERGASVKAQKRVCGICDVRGECLAFAIATNEVWGVWGGTTERERRKLRRAS
jgi:WhiB family redox-sensing transcriptional regulator